MDKLKCPFVGLLDFFRIAAAESMFAAGDRYQLMVDAKLLELLGHHDRLLEGHVGIFRTTDL